MLYKYLFCFLFLLTWVSNIQQMQFVGTKNIQSECSAIFHSIGWCATKILPVPYMCYDGIAFFWQYASINILALVITINTSSIAKTFTLWYQPDTVEFGRELRLQEIKKWKGSRFLFKLPPISINRFLIWRKISSKYYNSARLPHQSALPSPSMMIRMSKTMSTTATMLVVEF